MPQLFGHGLEHSQNPMPPCLQQWPQCARCARTFRSGKLGQVGVASQLPTFAPILSVPRGPGSHAPVDLVVFQLPKGVRISSKIATSTMLNGAWALYCDRWLLNRSALRHGVSRTGTERSHRLYDGDAFPRPLGGAAKRPKSICPV